MCYEMNKMRKNPTSVAVIYTVCTLLLLTIVFAITLDIRAFPVYAYNGNTRIYLDPSKITFVVGVNDTVGTLFNVTVMVEDVTDLACFEVRMYFNDSIINVTRWYEPADNPEYVFYGKDTLPVPEPPSGPCFYEHIDLGNGSAHAGVALFPAPPSQPSFDGSGVLCVFEFNITAVPEDGVYSCDLSIDNEDTFLLNSPGDEIPDVSKENGRYKIVPEFSQLWMLLTFMFISMVALAFHKRNSTPPSMDRSPSHSNLRRGRYNFITVHPTLDGIPKAFRLTENLISRP